MITILLALLTAVLLGYGFEGTARISGLLACCNVMRVGRVGVTTWAYRPGRVYVRVEVGA